MTDDAPPDADPGDASSSTAWSSIFRSAVESAFDAVLITGAELDHPGPRILYVNAAFLEMTGWPAEEIVGLTPRVLQGEGTDGRVLQRLRQALELGEAFDARTVNYRRDGSPFELEWRTAPIRDQHARITHYISIQRDVTAEKRLLDHLRQRADFDDLTATRTRRPAERMLKAEIKRCERHELDLGVVMFDIDWFKSINDEHGHPAGDEVLMQMTRLVRRRLRENDLLARWGGEECLMVLPHTAAEGARATAEAVRRIIEEATFVGGIAATISAGAAAYTTGDTPDTLIQRADAALYAAKEAGRDRVEIG